jgi:hypothetical protein
MPEQRHTKKPATSRDVNRPLYRLPRVLDTDDLCRALRVSAPTVRTLIASQQLRRLGYSKSRILVSREEVDRFLERQTVKPPVTQDLTHGDTPAPPWRDAVGEGSK